MVKKTLKVNEAEVNELIHGLLSYTANTISKDLLEKLNVLWQEFQEPVIICKYCKQPMKRAGKGYKHIWICKDCKRFWNSKESE